MNAQQLKASEHGARADALIAKGILPDWLAGVVTKYGPDVITFLETGLANGFSVQSMMDFIKIIEADWADQSKKNLVAKAKA